MPETPRTVLGSLKPGTLSNWRRWAILAIIAQDGFPAYDAHRLSIEMQRRGWGHLLPAHGRYDAVYRALRAEEKAGKLRRVGPRPFRWMVTDTGRDFTLEFILDNPHITPEACAASEGKKT